MFACAHKMPRSASTRFSQGGGPRARGRLSRPEAGIHTNSSVPDCEGDSFRRGGPLLGHSVQEGAVLIEGQQPLS
jgi:hypothetical protein